MTAPSGGSRSISAFFQRNVNRYESGTTPHTDFLITLAPKEKISIDWLLPGKGKMKPCR